MNIYEVLYLHSIEVHAEDDHDAKDKIKELIPKCIIINTIKKEVLK